jgi:hypothetical protein
MVLIIALTVGALYLVTRKSPVDRAAREAPNVEEKRDRATRAAQKTIENIVLDVCRRAITNTLRNPETAKFKDEVVLRGDELYLRPCRNGPYSTLRRPSCGGDLCCQTTS